MTSVATCRPLDLGGKVLVECVSFIHYARTNDLLTLSLRNFRTVIIFNLCVLHV